MHCQAHSQQEAFTLIEIVIGLALGTVVLFLAASAVASISESVAKTKEMSRDNELLRLGIQKSYEDVDFWHSHAIQRSHIRKNSTSGC